MRISDRYIGKQVLLGTVYAVAVLSLVLVLGNLFQKIRPLLVEQGAPPGLVLRFALNVLPYSLMFTLPWGFLSAVLLVFGKLSSGQEITGFRVAGVSLPRLAAPVFVIGALLSGVSLWLNVNVVPQAKASVYQLLYERAVSDPKSLLKPGVVQGDLSSDRGVKALIEGRSPGEAAEDEGDDQWVVGFHYYQLPSPNSASQGVTYVHARKAALHVDHVKEELRLKLVDAYFESTKPDGTVDMAFAGNAEPLLIPLRQPRSRRPRASAMTTAAILDLIEDDTEMTEAKQVEFRSEITRRYSFSMACLAFAFVAVPLGLKSRRSDTSGGLIISLMLGAAYFFFTLLANEFETDRAATAVLWAPNIACVLAGIYLFHRARYK
jgi:lipopolysaccharide export LptBFGC system permease protein LptF